MEFIKPSFEIWEEKNIWKHIAKCTRVCYQSTPKNENETNEEFVKRVILRNGTEPDFEKLHGAMLEHGTIYLFVPWNDEEVTELPEIIKHSRECYVYQNTNNPGSYITTNLRVIYENNYLDDLKYSCIPTKYHAKRVTVCFNTNIGVTREFNRHRVNSIAEESTRYCNYNKRNDGQLKIGLPSWLLNETSLANIKNKQHCDITEYCNDVIYCSDLKSNWSDIDYYLFALTVAEFCYNSLIEKGWKPQQAREVLPLATKSQLIHTAYIDDWIHFFKLRAVGVSGAPHPNAQLIARPLYVEFVNRGYIDELIQDTIGKYNIKL